MHPELEGLVIELMLQDKVKYFVDIKSFLIHIFKGEVYDGNTLKLAIIQNICILICMDYM